MLRNGRRIRVRERQVRNIDASRRACAAAESARSLARHTHHRQRLQLSRADRADHEPQGAAPVAGAADGTARRARRSERRFARTLVRGEATSAGFQEDGGGGCPCCRWCRAARGGGGDCEVVAEKASTRLGRRATPPPRFLAALGMTPRDAYSRHIGKAFHPERSEGPGG